MYSLFAKKENAHEDSIWTVDWGRRNITVQVEDDDDNQEDNDNNQEDKTKKTEENRQVDVVATGGVDDLVKVKVVIYVLYCSVNRSLQTCYVCF